MGAHARIAQSIPAVQSDAHQSTDRRSRDSDVMSEFTEVIVSYYGRKGRRSHQRLGALLIHSLKYSLASNAGSDGV